MKLRWFILLSTQKSSVSLRSLQTIDHLVLTTTQSLVISNVYLAINRVEKTNLSLTREFTDVQKLFLLWREVEDKINHYVSSRVFFLCEATKDAGD